MEQEILAIAIVRPNEGMEQQTLEVLRALYVVMTRKGYSRDRLYRDTIEPGRYFNLRYWSSDRSRREAQEDPEVHKYWSRLGNLCVVETVYEQLVDITAEK
ncbi:MAG TPA: hypothetical protein VK473_00910 [Terriglobales bacterium]|nr:hypothetical protein [Terriglobales bacterium]